MRKTRFSIGWILLGFSVSSLAANKPVPSIPRATSPTPVPPAIKIISDISLPPSLSFANEVRWASDHSVYLGLGVDGTVEVGLESATPLIRELIPGRSKPGGFWAVHRLAASSQYLVVAGPATVLTWRRLSEPTRVEIPFLANQAIDVRENRLAIVGLQQDDQGKPGPDGAIAWVGSLDKRLADLQPLLYDIGGKGAPHMDRCFTTQLGAVRFLADGSLVVVPGVQPGIHLFDPTGKLLRTWDTGALGIDTDCGSLSYDESRRLAARGVERQEWKNQRRTIDSVLPLQDGIGLLVRRFEQGRTRWSLKVLHKEDGSAQTYSVPLEGSSGFFELLGDARSGKLVFLLHESRFASQGSGHAASPRLIVAELHG